MGVKSSRSLLGLGGMIEKQGSFDVETRSTPVATAAPVRTSRDSIPWYVWKHSWWATSQSPENNGDHKSHLRAPTHMLRVLSSYQGLMFVVSTIVSIF